MSNARARRPGRARRAPHGFVDGHRTADEMADLVQSGHWRCICGEVVKPEHGPTSSAEFWDPNGHVVTFGGHAFCVQALAADMRSLGDAS